MTRTEKISLAKGLAFTSPWLVGFAVFTLIPVALSFYYSLTDYSLLNHPVYVGLANYRELFQDPVFLKSLKVTFTYAAIALPAGLIISLGLALMLNQKVAGQGIYRTMIFIPSLVPAVAASLLWMWLLNSRLGLINTVLDHLGISTILYKLGLPTPVPWITNQYMVLPSLALIAVWGCGNTVIIYLAGLQDVPTELYEAAEIDGAGPVSRLFNVTLPMLSPVVFFNLIMGVIGTLQVFVVPYIVTNKGEPARAAYFYTMYLYDTAFVYLRMGYASALAWIQLLIILALTALAFWTSKRWVHYRA